MMNFPIPFNYYPNTTVNLSSIAYYGMDVIASEVHAYNSDLSVVWGPVEHFTDGISDSRLFLARSATTNEYFVVIRGTNPISLADWFYQDFDLRNLAPINKLAPNVPDNALISQGSYNGLERLLNLVDTKQNSSLVQFLKSVNPPIIYITGHSLGGTLTPTLFILLNAVLYDAKVPPTNMAMFTFAGLTAGDIGFNDYLNGLLVNYQYPWRFHNTLDVAPLMTGTGNEQAVQDIYKPFKPSISPAYLESKAIEELFLIARNRYLQPTGKDAALTGQFDPKYPTYFDQLSQQHHATPTYIGLVKNAFPIDEG